MSRTSIRKAVLVSTIVAAMSAGSIASAGTTEPGSGSSSGHDNNHVAVVLGALAVAGLIWLLTRQGGSLSLKNEAKDDASGAKGRLIGQY